VSQHLKVLRDAGVLSGRRRGREMAYTIADEHIVHIAIDAIAHASEGRQAQRRAATSPQSSR
jgi:DNA-binding transcriptional ArsR family regulator